MGDPVGENSCFFISQRVVLKNKLHGRLAEGRSSSLVCGTWRRALASSLAALTVRSRILLPLPKIR